MKAVPRWSAPPPELVQYREEHPEDLNCSGGEAGKVWERFRVSGAFGATLDALIVVQQGLCAYCEQSVMWSAEELEEAAKKGLKLGAEGDRIVLDSQIEHVAAKSKGVGRALDPNNLMLCCWGGASSSLAAYPHRYAGPINESCGKTKDNSDSILDPRDLPLTPPLMRIHEHDGSLHADADVCAALNLPVVEVKRVVNDVLKLNCGRLRAARSSHLGKADTHRALLRDMVKDVRATERLLTNYVEALTEAMLAPNERGHLRPFWSVWRQALEPFSTRWIEENRHRLNFPAGTPP